MKFLAGIALMFAVAACGGEAMDDTGMPEQSGMAADTGHMMSDSMMGDSMMGDTVMARDTMGAM